MKMRDIFYFFLILLLVDVSRSNTFFAIVFRGSADFENMESLGIILFPKKGLTSGRMKLMMNFLFIFLQEVRTRKKMKHV
jgi:hypothetical protein